MRLNVETRANKVLLGKKVQEIREILNI
jgi:hypothetical protein